MSFLKKKKQTKNKTNNTYLSSSNPLYTEYTLPHYILEISILGTSSYEIYIFQEKNG